MGESDEADVCLSAGTEEQFSRIQAQITAADTLDNRFWCKRLDDGSRYLRWDTWFEFLVSPDARHIRYRRLADGTRESFTTYLLGPVLSFSLLALGSEPLHGTAIVVDSKAVVFLGGCGWGKSTLAAALLARGLPVLSDDLIALARHDQQWMVHPGLPRLKLFPAIARRLLGIESRGPRMNAGTSKLVLPLGQRQFRQEVTPLRAVYVLSRPARKARGAADEVRIDRLSARDAFLELVGAAFNLVVAGRQRLANQFTLAAAMASTVSVCQVSYPRRFTSLPAVCDALLADLAGRSASLPAKRYVARTPTT